MIYCYYYEKIMIFILFIKTWYDIPIATLMIIIDNEDQTASKT